jgi:hypothetical protein
MPGESCCSISTTAPATHLQPDRGTSARTSPSSWTARRARSRPVSAFPAPRRRTPRRARSSPATPAFTGCTPTPLTALSTSSPRSGVPTRWAATSTSGTSPWARIGPARLAGRSWPSTTAGGMWATPRHPLNAHAQIQLEVGKPLAAPQVLSAGLLMTSPRPSAASRPPNTFRSREQDGSSEAPTGTVRRGNPQPGSACDQRRRWLTAAFVGLRAQFRTKRSPVLPVGRKKRTPWPAVFGGGYCLVRLRSAGILHPPRPSAEASSACEWGQRPGPARLGGSGPRLKRGRERSGAAGAGRLGLGGIWKSARATPAAVRARLG